MFERLKRLFTKRVKNSKTPQRGMITRTCKICGKTFTIPENVQHWPDCCQECRAKYRPVENITRKCRKCAGRWRTSPESAGNAGRPSLSRQTPLAGQNIARNVRKSGPQGKRTRSAEEKGHKMISIEEKTKRIIEDIQQEKGCNPVRIFKNMAQKEYISIHGPEHHILDGACILTAFYNAGGNIRLEESLNKIAREGLRMPGAMCGLWGICGAIASVGAALAIIDGTGPLSDDGTWGEHMKFTSQAIG